jgi:hypothetical protein
MRPTLLIMLLCTAVLLGGCETTETSGGTQEAKRRAAMERQRNQPAPDESQINLWGAHNDVVNRDTNPLRAY